MIEAKYIERIATELSLKPEQVSAAIALFEAGATIPFVARYRPDATDGLTEPQLEAVAERNNYFIGVMNRCKAILDALAKHETLTDGLREQIANAYDKSELEDLFLPHKSRRPTRAAIAENQGLVPLADFILKQLPGLQTVEDFADAFVKPEAGVSSPQEAFEGALYVLVERFAMDPETRRLVRGRMFEKGKVTARPTKNAEGKKTKYSAYYEFSEPLSKIPSHRLLAVLRGAKEGVLRVDVTLDDDKLIEKIVGRYVTDPTSPFEPYIRLAVREAYQRHMRPALEGEAMDLLRKKADSEAIMVFRENARNLLLAPPARNTAVIGAVPGPDSVCKLAVVTKDGVFAEHQTVFLNAEEAAQAALLALVKEYDAYGIVVANGKGAMETARLAKKVLGTLDNERAFVVTLNAGPSAGYATSRLGREELPDVETPVREAVSLARRVQDPLAELVKVEPRAIGVGQYQHDVNQKQLREGLQRTMVSCVSHVSVDLNRASAALLRYVCGMQLGTAQNIVAAREAAGGFKSRRQLLEVDGIGPKVFEQCAGFLHIADGENPLDRTAVHPEAYGVVEQMAAALGLSVAELLGNRDVLAKADLAPLATDAVGPRALECIRQALMAPGRDPRGAYKAPRLVEGVASLDDLKDGQEVEGVVTNVTNFGAFVDVGVQQDGLVHLSELSNRFVKDPREVIGIGEVVKVKVLKVDKDPPRISLSIRALMPPPPKRQPRKRPPRPPAGDKAAGAERGRERPDAPRRGPRPEAGGGPRARRPEGGGERRTDGRRPDPRRTRPQRGDRRDREGDARRPAGARRGRPAQRPHGKAAQQARDEERLNTQFAEQLAALWEKKGD